MPGSPMAQFGVIRRNESHLRERHVSATRPASITTWSTFACDRYQLVARPAWPAPMMATSTARSIGLFDQVALGRLDLDASGFQILDAPVELLGIAGDLEQDPALVARDVGAPDVGHDVELLAQVVDDRLLHHVRSEDELEPPPSHGRESKGDWRPPLRPARSRSRPSL